MQLIGLNALKNLKQQLNPNAIMHYCDEIEDDTSENNVHQGSNLARPRIYAKTKKNNYRLMRIFFCVLCPSNLKMP